MGKAYFMKNPRTYEELLKLQPNNPQQDYEITCKVTLDPLDYENFIFGLDADRQYIEDNAHLCSDGPIKKCVLVQRESGTGGILVIPDPQRPCYVLWAAYKEK